MFWHRVGLIKYYILFLFCYSILPASGSEIMPLNLPGGSTLQWLSSKDCTSLWNLIVQLHCNYISVISTPFLSECCRV